MAYPNYYNGGYFPQYQNGAVPDMLNQYKGQYQQMPMQQPVQPLFAKEILNDCRANLNDCVQNLHA